MVILYISALPKTKSGGPRYSVPKQIAAQSKYDDVYWVNLNEYGVKTAEIESHDLDPKKFRVEDLTAPYNSPDLVIFEDFYHLEYCFIAHRLKKRNIPYIIVPRGSLTLAAQRQKIIKKKIANLFLFKRFARSAMAIQYLTEMEQETSGNKWNNRYIILPNGTDKRTKIKAWTKVGNLNGIFIGRMNMYHKGLDLLINACIELKEELIRHRCKINLYGPDRNGAKRIIEGHVREHGLEKIIKIGEEIHGFDKEEALIDSDFFILTSRFEGHPMGLIEALSYGLPSLVTIGTNMADQISQADAGWVAHNSVDGIILAFRKLLEEKESIPQKGKNSLELSHQYQWNNIAKKSSEVYSGMLQYRK